MGCFSGVSWGALAGRVVWDARRSRLLVWGGRWLEALLRMALLYAALAASLASVPWVAAASLAAEQALRARLARLDGPGRAWRLLVRQAAPGLRWACLRALAAPRVRFLLLLTLAGLLAWLRWDALRPSGRPPDFREPRGSIAELVQHGHGTSASPMPRATGGDVT